MFNRIIEFIKNNITRNLILAYIISWTAFFFFYRALNDILPNKKIFTD